VVKRRCRLARASFDDGCMLEKNGFCSREEEPFELYGVSVSGDRRFGKRSSSMRPLKVLENAIFEDYMMQQLAKLNSESHL
jgi:hypothetical protein